MFRRLRHPLLDSGPLGLVLPLHPPLDALGQVQPPAPDRVLGRPRPDAHEPRALLDAAPRVLAALLVLAAPQLVVQLAPLHALQRLAHARVEVLGRRARHVERVDVRGARGRWVGLVGVLGRGGARGVDLGVRFGVGGVG